VSRCSYEFEKRPDEANRTQKLFELPVAVARSAESALVKAAAEQLHVRRRCRAS
jgi:hypothetical protein